MTLSLQEALALGDAGQLEAARAALTELRKQTPDDPMINYHCAVANDRLGDERAAIPLYEHAITHGLSDEYLRSAMLGLGSSYNVVGDYEQAVATLQKGRETFPEAREFDVFLALALHRKGEYAPAMQLLLHTIVETTADPDLKKYSRAIRYYADHLDEVFP